MIYAALGSFFQKFVFILTYIFFEVKYYILGGCAIIDDIISRPKNKCDTVTRSKDVAVVTGGARGLGYELVKKLLKCDMKIIIGCRSVTAGNDAVFKLRASGISTGSICIYQLDMSSFESIREFVRLVQNNHKFINILVNNAGIMFVPYEEKEGFESQWTVNYMGPFLLTHLLMPLLENAPGPNKARIINISSCAHYAANSLCIDGVYSIWNFITSEAYAQSKLAQILFTKELNRRLVEKRSNVISVAVHPGIVDTDIFDGTLLKKLFPWILKYICKNPDEGATTILYACISPYLENRGGSYISNCKIQRASDLAENETLQNEIFNLSSLQLNIDDYGIN